MLLDNYVPEATEEDISQVETTITAIKAALEAKDEPVAQWQKKHATKTEGRWENTNGPDAKWWLNNSVGWEIRALYTTPPQRTWVGLTDEERYELLDKAYNPESYAVLVEAKLKEKNGL